MPALNLKSFNMKRLRLDSESPKTSADTIQSDIAFSWKASVDKDDSLNRILSFGMKSIAPPADKNTSAVSIDVIIEGRFRMAEDIPEVHLDEVLLINGSTILYGILRGVLASLSGAFAVGQLVLPTIDMTDVVQGMLKDQKSGRKKTTKPHGPKKAVRK